MDTYSYVGGGGENPHPPPFGAKGSRAGREISKICPEDYLREMAYPSLGGKRSFRSDLRGMPPEDEKKGGKGLKKVLIIMI